MPPRSQTGLFLCGLGLAEPVGRGLVVGRDLEGALEGRGRGRAVAGAEMGLSEEDEDPRRLRLQLAGGGEVLRRVGERVLHHLRLTDAGQGVGAAGIDRARLFELCARAVEVAGAE